MNQKVIEKWELVTFYIESKDFTRTFHILYWIKRNYDYREIEMRNISHFILNQKIIEKWREHFTFYIESKGYREMTRTFHILYWIKRLYRNDENISHFILDQKIIKKWRELVTFYIESKGYREMTRTFHILYWIKRL